MIETHHLSKLYGRGVYALRDLTITIDKGEFLFLTGPSGAGKSTLLKLILRQMKPSEGQIIVNGRNLHSMRRSQLPWFRREIGMVFQDFKLIDRMTVFEKMFTSGRRPGDIVRADGLAQIDDESQLAGLIADVLAHNADAVAMYRGGKSTTFGFLVGQVMKAARGQANPTRVNELLRKALGA